MKYFVEMNTEGNITLHTLLKLQGMKLNLLCIICEMHTSVIFKWGMSHFLQEMTPVFYTKVCLKVQADVF